MNRALETTVRRVTLDDASRMAKLGAETFTETFGHLYSPQDLQHFLEESHSEAAWAAKLAKAGMAVWLAEIDDTPTGFIAVGPCKLPVKNLEPDAGEVQQLYVLKTHHNLKLGSRLMDIGMQWLEEQGFMPLYVGVWSENEGAQRFYRRYGFEKFGEYGFPVGDTIDREFIMKRRAMPRGLEGE